MLPSTINRSDSVKEYLSSGCQQHRIDNRSLSLTASRRGHNRLQVTVVLHLGLQQQKGSRKYKLQSQAEGTAYSFAENL